MMRHFYHVYAGGAWSAPVREHLAALEASGLNVPMTVGIVGEPTDRARCKEIMTASGLFDVFDEWIEADEGYEELTLRAVADWCSQPGGRTGEVLYCHTKGARDDSEFNTAWRRSMTARLVGGWRECVALLADGWDTVGCHWLTPERDNDPPRRPVYTPIYGGNFWWANSRYINQLPPVKTERRHQCEEWIGLAGPLAYDLLPGWPSLDLFGEDTPHGQPTPHISHHPDMA